MSTNEKKTYMGFVSEIPSTSRVVRREVGNKSKRGLNAEEVALLKKYRGKDFFKVTAESVQEAA